MTDWCILRTAGRDTMRLARTLAEDGFDVWTPIETRTMCVPRANVKREVQLPIMPRYVFARAGHLIDLLELAAMPVKPRRGARMRDPAHVGFSVLHCFGGIPLIADRHLVELRKIEVKRTPFRKAERALPIGIGVRINGGSFGGLKGTVDKSNRGKTIVCLNPRFSVEIPTSLLELDGVCAPEHAALEAA